MSTWPRMGWWDGLGLRAMADPPHPAPRRYSGSWSPRGSTQAPIARRDRAAGSSDVRPHAKAAHGLVVLLAAGRSERFGASDKLLAPFAGRPLIDHAASAVRRLGRDRQAAVVSSPHVAARLADFLLITNPDPGQGLSGSLRLAAQAAVDHNAASLLIVLGDMPRIPTEHLHALQAQGEDRPLVSSSGARRMPPVYFPASWFDRLRTLSGDEGARHLLSAEKGIAALPLPAGLAIDVDRPEDLVTGPIDHTP